MSLIARRPRLIAAAALASAAGLAAAAAWALWPRPAAPDAPLGPRIAIDLFTPETPEIAPGGVMEVGALNNGFDDAALRRGDEGEDAAWTPPEAYAGPDLALADPPLMPAPRAVVLEDIMPLEAAAARDPLRDGSRWFGLDRLMPTPETPPAATDAETTGPSP